MAISSHSHFSKLFAKATGQKAQDHVDPDIDFHRLAARFDITGGYIKNAVLRAAMMAASHGRRLDEDHLADAAAAVCEELGRLVKPR